MPLCVDRSRLLLEFEDISGLCSLTLSPRPLAFQVNSAAAGVQRCHCDRCLAELMSQTSDRVVVFVNGRDVPGSNAAWNNEQWSSVDREQFWGCKLQLLGRVAHRGQPATSSLAKISLVVLCRDRLLAAEDGAALLVPDGFGEECGFKAERCLSEELKPERIVEGVLNSWPPLSQELSDDEKRCVRFVYA